MCRNLLFVLTLLPITPTSFGAVSVTLGQYDNNRTGANVNETVLTTANVNVNSFGRLFSRNVDGQIYAQPLYVSNVTIPGQGAHNVVYVATEHASVYAFDADNPASSTPLWYVNFGPSVPAPTTYDLVGEVGITGTPVIDLNTNTLYVVAETNETGSPVFRLHALDITTGAEKFSGPVVISASVSGASFGPSKQWQRPGLLLLNGNVYIAFGSHQDLPPYQGWVLGYSASTLQQTAVFCDAPNTGFGGVWQSGAGPAADANGFIYVQTGNGVMDVNTGGSDYGDSVVKLDSNRGLAPADYFSPSNQVQLGNNDLDLGASGPLLIPGTSLGLGGGKDGNLYVWNTSNLEQFHSTDQVVQEWPATKGLPSGGGGLYGGYVYYNSTLYLWSSGDTLKAFAFNGSSFNTTPVSQSTFTSASGIPANPALSVSANGTTPGTAIIWGTYPTTGLANGDATPGILRAFDASDLSHELWNSNQNQARDYSGSWSKWCPPTIASGKVYVATFDNVLNVYGLLSGESITATAGTPQSATVSTAFTTALQATVKDAGSNPLSGVTVTFTAPGSGASGTFSGTGTATAVTNGSGVATAPAFTANATAGSYTVTASVSGVAPANFSLTNSTASSGSGSLTGAVNSATTAVNLTTEGTLDWMHWGDGGASGQNRKANVSAQLNNFAAVGGAPFGWYGDDPRQMSWSDGTPTATLTNDGTGLTVTGTGVGFSFTAPADTNVRTLTVHIGGYNSSGTLTAKLSDGSAANFVDTSTLVNGQYDRNYTLTYNAGKANQSLTVSWVLASGNGNVTLTAAGLH